MAGREHLDSDRVNFLIWRYLLEGNYRETAAKFQKEWHVKEPHREFDWAPHVKGHALVSVINRGLHYHALEREFARHQIPQNAHSGIEAPQVGVFGPLVAQQPPKIEEEDSPPNTGDVEATRKRSQQHEHQVPNGQPAKKPRLSNGYENGLDAAAEGSAMDVDQPEQDHLSHDNHAYPSPLEGEQGPTPVARTDGPEQGTQVEKVEELAPETSFIRLADDLAPAPTQDAPSSPSGTGAENPPILLQCEWNPRDPSLLAGAGTDALGRVWTVSRPTAPAGSGHDHVSPPAVTLVSPDRPRNTTVTALSWTSDGNAIAVATDLGTYANITVWSTDGAHLQSTDVAEGPILKLSWNPSNTGLLALSPDNGGALVTVHYPPAGTSISHNLPNHNINETQLDAAWTSDSELLLCGGDVFLGLHCRDSKLEPVREFSTSPDDGFVQVLFDRHSNLAATSSSKGNLDLWDHAGQRRTIAAHQGAITTMAWQPLPSIQPTEDERLIATGGEDCAILVWNARMPEKKSKCFLTMDSPIVRLAFTPDGAFIAGATSSQVLIWKVGSSGLPRASWNRPADAGWLSPRANSEPEEEDEHCLCWDATGQKLAYGSNSRLAIINFCR